MTMRAERRRRRQAASIHRQPSVRLPNGSTITFHGGDIRAEQERVIPAQQQRERQIIEGPPGQNIRVAQDEQGMYWYTTEPITFTTEYRTVATTASTPRPPAPAPPTILTATPEVPILCSSTYRGSLTVVLVGAGGTGARVIGPLTQMLRQGDHIAIIDHDIVEDRNLVRQHFASRDIGQHKAVVLAQRYARPGRINIAAHVAQLIAASAGTYMADVLPLADNGRRRGNAVVFIGCVDNALARQAIMVAMMYVVRLGTATAWIDVGNETRGGQVLMSLGLWPLRVAGQDAPNWKLATMEQAMPQLLRPAPEETASCGERIDLQTVQVNHLSAAAAINCLSWLMLGIPFVACGAFFSTLNTMQSIRITGADFSRKVLTPDTTYAMAAE